mgnify:CR=1 FL=1
MFQWLLDAPQPAADSYLYYTNGLGGQLYRVALDSDHIVEPIFLTTTLSLSGEAIAADRARGTLFSYNATYNTDGFIVRSNVAPFDGSGYTTVITAPNPDGVNVPPAWPGWQVQSSPRARAICMHRCSTVVRVFIGVLIRPP